MVILIPISWLKKYKNLSYSSFFANICIAISCIYIYFYYLVIVIFKYGLQDFFNEQNKISQRNIMLYNFSNLPLFFGIAVFCFEGRIIKLKLKEIHL